jgi:hypothetical protein
MPIIKSAKAKIGRSSHTETKQDNLVNNKISVKCNRSSHYAARSNMCTYSLMELSPSWQAANCAATQKINPAFYGTRRFITVFTRALDRSLFWTRSIQSIPSHPISRRSILVLSTHLRLGTCVHTFMLSTIDILIGRKNSYKIRLREAILVPTKWTSPHTILPPETHLTDGK